MIDPAQGGTPGGSFPRAVVWTSPTRAYVASERDREIIALDVAAGGDQGGRRACRTGGQPVALVGDRGPRLYAALDNTDRVAVIDTAATDRSKTHSRRRCAGGQALPGRRNALACRGRPPLLVTNGG